MKLEVHVPYEEDMNWNQLVSVLEVIAEKEGLRLRKTSFTPHNLEVKLVVVTPESRPVGLRTEMATRHYVVSADVYRPYDGGPVYAKQPLDV